MNTPKISVLLSCFNHAHHIKRLIPSILNQTFQDFEFIIINDGSVDNSPDIINKFSLQDSRIVPVHQENIGLTKSLNKGIRLARGDYIARIDADDVSYEQRLEKQYNFLEQNRNIVLVGGQRVIIDKIKHVTHRENFPLTTNEIRKNAVYRNPFFHSLVMFRKNIVEKVGTYDESFKFVQDYELWSRIIHNYETANLDEVLGEKVIEESATSFGKNVRLSRNMFSLKARYRNFIRGSYPLYSIYYLFKPLYRVIRSIPSHFMLKII